MHALDALGGVAHDRGARARGARDGYERDVGVAGERAAGLGAGAGHHVEDPGRQAGLEREAAQHQRRQRRQLGGLEHDGVAGGQRGPDLPAGHVERVVPGGDRGADAERLAPDRARVALEVLAGGLALEVARGGGEEAQVVDAQGEVERARELQRLARVARLHAGELVGALLEQVGHAVQHGGALAGGDAAPVAAPEGGLGGGDGVLGVGRGAVGDLGDRLAGGRVGHGARARRGDVLAVDEQRVDCVLCDGHLVRPPGTLLPVGSTQSVATRGRNVQRGRCWPLCPARL